MCQLVLHGRLRLVECQGHGPVKKDLAAQASSQLGQFCPAGDFCQCLETFLTRVWLLTSRSRSQGCCEHPATQRTAPTTKSHFLQSVHSTTVRNAGLSQPVTGKEQSFSGSCNPGDQREWTGLAGTNSYEGNGTPLQYPCLQNPMDGLELRRPWGFSPEARRGSQGASRAAPGML